MKKLSWVLAGALALAPSVVADDEGHHHEEITQEQLGTVHFPISCAPAEQKAFEKGVALLHSFWYPEARKAFQELEKQDPKCAMAYWGEAMSMWHQLWEHPSGDTIKQAQATLKKGDEAKPQTARERDYIAAIEKFYSSDKDYYARADAYSDAMQKVYQKYPDDHEAAAFYALSLLAAEPENDTTFANRKKAGQVLQPLFDSEPNHPGVAHYLIHTYDKPQLAQLGLPAAQRYAKIAPAAPHALHMPSHIFARLGLWQEDIDSNLASIAATRKTAAMNMGGASHQFHAMDFLIYAYLQNGHDADAKKLIEEVQGMGSMKEMDDMGDERTYTLVVGTARYPLELHRWADAASLKPLPDTTLRENSITYGARIVGAARSGNVAQAKKDLKELDNIHQKLLDNKRNEAAESVELERKASVAWIDFAEGKKDAAIAAMREAAAMEEARGDRSDAALPAREMLADMLLEMKRPDEALVEYQADLKFYPNRFNGLYGAGQAAELAGKHSQAAEYYALLVKSCEGATSDRPELKKARETAVAAK
jgi:tetratricopeptide (TPR) repeat protein